MHISYSYESYSYSYRYPITVLYYSYFLLQFHQVSCTFPDCHVGPTWQSGNVHETARTTVSYRTLILEYRRIVLYSYEYSSQNAAQRLQIDMPRGMQVEQNETVFLRAASSGAQCRICFEFQIIPRLPLYGKATEVKLSPFRHLVHAPSTSTAARGLRP